MATAVRARSVTWVQRVPTLAVRPRCLADTESDPGWGIAGWLVPDKFATFYDDDAFEASYYPHMRAYMEHWITLANGNNGVLPIFWWGDWGESRCC